MVFVAGISVSIWLRRFGLMAQRAGSLIALPFVTLLTTPYVPTTKVGPVSRTGWAPRSRCTVLADSPVNSSNRLAALPVGAASTIRAPRALASSTTADTVRLFPVPGPPVSRWAAGNSTSVPPESDVITVAWDVETMPMVAAAMATRRTQLDGGVVLRR